MKWNKIGLGFVIAGFFSSLIGIITLVFFYRIDLELWGFFSLFFGVILILAGNGFINYTRSNLSNIIIK